MTVLTIEQAEGLVARTFAAIPVHPDMADRIGGTPFPVRAHAADRERVASDLAGLRDSLRWYEQTGDTGHQRHARRYSDGLLRTAALYGVTP